MFDQPASFALTPRDSAALSELYNALQPAAARAYEAYFLERTRHHWQDDMVALVRGTSGFASALPVYERAYVSDWYLQLLPGAQADYTEYFVVRTPADYQADMALLVQAGAPLDDLSWGNAVVAAGGTVSAAQQALVTTLVNNLKAAGIWGTLDRLYLFASENIQQAGIDLVGRSQLTLGGAPIFTAQRGYAGNNSFLDSGFNASTDPAPHFVLLNGSMGVWMETANTTVDGREVGNGTPGVSWISTNGGGNQLRAGVNNSAAASYISASNSGVKTGWFHAQRGGSSFCALLRNGLSVAFAPSSNISPLNNATHIFLGSGGQFSNGRIAAGFVGGNLSGKEVALYNAMRAYMTGVGVA